MPDDNDNGHLADAISAMTTGYIGQGAMVTSYIVIASFITADGDRNIITDTASNQRNHESLGLLSWGMAVENARAADTWREDGEDE